MAEWQAMIDVWDAGNTRREGGALGQCENVCDVEGHAALHEDLAERAIFYCGEGRRLIKRHRAEVFCLALDTFRCVAAVEGAQGGGKGGMSADKVREYRAWLWGQAMKLDEEVWAKAHTIRTGQCAGSTDDFEEILKSECATRVGGGGEKGVVVFVSPRDFPILPTHLSLNTHTL